MRAFAILVVLAGCYHPSYRDCEVACTTTCPDGLACHDNMCRVAGAVGECAIRPPGEAGNDAGADAPFVHGGTMLALAAGNHTCAACGDGSLWCWGQNDLGQSTGSAQLQCNVQSPQNDCSPTPVSFTLPNAATVRELAGGVNSTFAIADIGSSSHLFGWGDNSAGQFAQAAPTQSRSPIDLGFTGLTDVAAGDLHACEIQMQRVSCQGDNASGELAAGNTTPHSGPVSFSAPTATALVAHGQHSCMITTPNGQGQPILECWGDNAHGQINGAPTATQTLPTVVPLTSNVSAAGAGSEHTCAVVAGLVECWGANQQGQCGSTTTGDVAVTTVPQLAGVEEVAGGGTQTCARTTDGLVYCWGTSSLPPLPPPQPMPTKVTLPAPALSISVGRVHTCAVLTDHTLWCWGIDQYGQLGDGTHDTQVHPPQRVTVCE